jgi:hypothetical protein
MPVEQRVGSLSERKRETMTVHSNDRLTRNTKLDRIGMRAQAHPDTVFNNIAHVMTEELLHEAYRQLDGKKAVGIDEMDKATYGKALTENIGILINKIRRRQYRPKASRIVEIPKEEGSTRRLPYRVLRIRWFNGLSVKSWNRYTSQCFCLVPTASARIETAMMP